MILVELSKLLKDGKFDKNAKTTSSKFLQLVDAVFDEAAEQMEVEQDDQRSDEDELLESLNTPHQIPLTEMVKRHYKTSKPRKC